MERRSRLRIALVEPFFGGSHRAFAEGLARHSAHRVDLVTLPPRLWKWRLRASALPLAERIAALRPRPDLLVISSLADGAQLLGLLGGAAPPAAMYFHENQIGYPRPEGKGADLQLGVANLASALAARTALFNSRFHRDDFLGKLPAFLRRLPAPRPAGVLERLRRRSRVLHPGVELPPPPRARPAGDPPVILWNHRWEFDKKPGRFFRICYQLREAGAAFRLVLLGDNSQFVPKPFLAARARLGDRILRYGRAPARREYLRWLARSDVVISTAAQENFGMAVVEAVAAGCYPLVPRALAYPEVLPARLHREHLYRDPADLLARLLRLRARPERIAAGRENRGRAVARYAWSREAPRYDRQLARIAGREGP